MTIGRQISHGVFWVGISVLTAQTLSFATQLIMMRILPRSAFGMIALAGMAINALLLFRELGFGAALIYRKDRVREAADTMFVMLVAISVLLYLIAFLGAAPIAAFFYPNPADAVSPNSAAAVNPSSTDAASSDAAATVSPSSADTASSNAAAAANRQELEQILRILSLVMIIGSVGQVPYVMLAKEMRFRRRLLPDIVPEIVKDTTTIALALNGFGVWSLVVGQLVDSVLTTLLLWVVSPLRPRPHVDMGIARELFGYGKHIQASQILVFLITNIDNAFVGRLLGDDPLGVYSRAFTISNLPSTQVTRLAGQVMFPAFSRIRDDLGHLQRVFLRAVKYTALVSVPLGVTIFFFSFDFINILYGAKWKDAIVPMQFLVIYGVIRSIAGNMGDIFKAGGKPQWLFGIAVWRLATMAIFLYPVTVKWGIVGVSALSAVVAIADFAISVLLVNRIAKTRLLDFVRILSPIMGLSLVSVAAARLVFRVASSFYPPLALILAGAHMVIIYAIMVLALDNEVRTRMIRLLGELPAGERLLHRLSIHLPPLVDEP
jgi:O-antigen/teichoic acid export membrane protein